MLRALADLPLTVLLLGLVAVSMWLPASYAVIHSDHVTARAFLYSGLMVLVLAAMLGIATANRRPRNPVRASLAALVLAYLVLPLAMALPVHQALGDTRYLNAWFEMVSSFTTTGASVYEVGRLPEAVHLWRAQVGWMGGFFILVAGMAILAPMNLGGIEVVTGRVPGRGEAGLSQITHTATPARRMLQQAGVLLPAYLGLTVVLWGALVAAGDRSFVAFCHAMSAVATSGISPVGGLQSGAAGLAGEMAVFVVLMAALSRRVWPGAVLYDRGGRLRDDPELRLGLAIVVLLPLVLFLRHWVLSSASMPEAPLGVLRSLWGGAFTTLSFLTTTGFTSSQWDATTGWSGFGTPGLVLAGLALFGGGIATTAGGVKLLRLYALAMQGGHELERLVHPHVVGGSGALRRRLRGEGAYLAWVYFMLFAGALAVAATLLTLLGVEFEPALILSIAALTSAGPLADVAGVPQSFAALGPGAKVVLAGVMVLGRVELLAMLVLLAPAGWRR